MCEAVSILLGSNNIQLDPGLERYCVIIQLQYRELDMLNKNLPTLDGYLRTLTDSVSFLMHILVGSVFLLLPVIALVIAIVGCLIVFDPNITLDIVQAKFTSLVNQ